MTVENLNLTTSHGPTTAYVARPHTDATAAIISDPGMVGHQRSHPRYRRAATRMKVTCVSRRIFIAAKSRRTHRKLEH